MIIPSSTHAAETWHNSIIDLFTRYNEDRGSSIEYITAIEQDREGYLWIGTANNLARFDGYHFKSYGGGATGPYGLPDSNIRTLHTDTQGRLWVGTSAAGLVRYDPAIDRFVRVPLEIMGHIDVRSIEDDGEGGLWVGTESGLDHLPANQATADHLHGVDNPAGGVVGDKVQAMKRDHRGYLWVGTANGLAYLRPGQTDFRSIPLPRAAAMDSVTALYEDGHGRLWVGTSRHGVLLVQLDKDGVAEFQPLPAPFTSVAGDWVKAILEVAPDIFWVGTMGNGILEVDLAAGTAKTIKRNRTVPDSLLNDNILSLYKDKSGLIWVGTYPGLCRFDPTAQAFRFLTPISTNPQTEDRSAHSLMVTPDGKLWLGRGRGGVDVLDATGQLLAHLASDPNDPNHALPSKSVRSFAVQQNGTVWIGTRDGLYRTDLNASAVRLVHVPGLDTSLNISSLLWDGSQLWIGDANIGVWSYNPSAGTVRPLGQGDGGLRDQRITVLEPAEDHSLWIGTYSGLYLARTDTGRVQKIDLDSGNPTTLTSHNIASLATDRQGRLWATLYGQGVAMVGRPDANGRRPVKFLASDVEPLLATANAVAQDEDGFIWVSTDTGVVRIDPITMAIRAFQRSDGVWLTTHWSTSVATGPNGEILFGAEDGVTLIHPRLLADWTYVPPVVVTQAYIGRRQVPGWQVAHTTTPLTVNPDEHGFRLEVASLDFSAPERNRYAYKLEGLDRDWQEIDGNWRQIAYTNLPPGNYTLRARGSNRSGQWSSAEVTVPLAILPAWYQTWWAQILGIAGLAGVVGLVVRGRTAILRRRQRELEAVVAQRTTELTEANAALTQSAAILRRLGDAGQDITATLILDAVLSTLKRYVGELLTGHRLVLYRLQGSYLEPATADGSVVEPVYLDDPQSLPARAAQSRQELTETVEDGVALAYPLVVENRVLGVLVVVADHAYGDREQMIFRTLCAYSAIALENAESYRRAETAWMETAQALADLRTTQSKLVQQEKMASLGRLVAGVAHEVNTPLGVVLTAAGSLRGSLEDVRDNIAQGKLTRSALETGLEEWSDLADLVERNTKRTAALVKSFTAIAAEDGESKVTEVDLSTLLPDVADVARTALAQGAIELTVDVPYGLVVSTVPESLVNALTHILANTADHAFDPGSHGHVTVTASAEGGVVMISIADNGRGIPADVLPHILDPFFTTARGRGHPGLGLHVAYNHVTQRLKGNLTVDSVPGQGTTVTLVIPSMIAANQSATAADRLRAFRA
ncbi:two-component regulator propeller domain-containing protein [Nitrospirillum sp. BR 11828]|uniref:two-component regulator propeller domain-containing protein n=1 Tax=Nitrospirillum sp. BR 11828 TaxID=3104325 RepID=UPI002ACA59E0|nr:two-component regulator propeller domain-containing protein [Nitrospirillum sp. BR 11828]MDZ5650684.1 two-component regulator propeller domain-containing protein [Nitrospirillum sp. BR 11828]